MNVVYSVLLGGLGGVIIYGALWGYARAYGWRMRRRHLAKLRRNGWPV